MILPASSADWISTMTELTSTASHATLDARFPTSRTIDYVFSDSSSGSSVFGGMARTAVGVTGWAADLPRTVPSDDLLASATPALEGTHI